MSRLFAGGQARPKTPQLWPAVLLSLYRDVLGRFQKAYSLAFGARRIGENTTAEEVLLSRSFAASFATTVSIVSICNM